MPIGLQNRIVRVRIPRPLPMLSGVIGNIGGSGPLVLGSNPGGAALEGSAQWWASGLENRAGCDSLGVRFLYFPLEDVARGRHLPC